MLDAQDPVDHSAVLFLFTPSSNTPQVRELAIELTSSRASEARAVEEVGRLKTLHSQVKGGSMGVCSARLATCRSVHAQRPCTVLSHLLLKNPVFGVTCISQVKGALQGAYSQNQELAKQIKELESLCSAQQSSLEEAEERYRGLADTHDALRHTNLQAKAQLVTAQAQVRGAGLMGLYGVTGAPMPWQVLRQGAADQVPNGHSSTCISKRVRLFM